MWSHRILGRSVSRWLASGKRPRRPVPVRPALEQLERREVLSSPPTLTSLSPTSAVEGSGAFTLTVTGTNFDSTATVLFNGTQLTTVFNSATQLQAQVTGALAAEEGSATVAVTEDSGTSGTLAFTLNDAPLSNLTLNDPGGEVEGKSTGTFTIATFTDANTGAPATDFTATITWGDGTSSTGTVVALGSGIFGIQAGHTFAEEGGVTVTVQVLDVAGSSISGSFNATVADAPLSNLTVNVPPSATENINTGSFTVATFTDANTNAPLTDFTAVINWGDGSTDTVSGSGIVSVGGGTFGVLDSHTYSDTGSFSIAAKVLDVGGSSISGTSSTFTVAPSPVEVTSVAAPPSPTEGANTGTFTVATFTDSNTTETASNFTAVIGWGDGTTSTVTSASGISGSNGSFTVTASHTYAEEITTPTVVSVQILDADGANDSSISSSFTVADAALSNLTVNAPASPTEGTSTGTFTVATFTDANTAAPVSDFTAVIQWGDGGTDTLSGSSIVSEGGGTFAVLDSHTYTTAGTFSIAAAVTDVGGSSISGTSSSFTVATAAPTLTSLSPSTAVEGSAAFTLTVTGNFFDSTATVLFNGTPLTTSFTSATQVQAAVPASLVAEEGTASVAVTEDNGTSGTLAFTITDAALSNLVINNPNATAGTNTGTFTVATFNDANTGAPTSDFTATIGWGDGSTSTVSGGGIVSQGGGSFAVLSSHTYGSAGNFPLSVAVADVGGASVSGSTGISVASVPTPTSSSSSSSSQGNINMLLFDEIFLAYELALYNTSGNPILLGGIAVLTGDVLSNPAFYTSTGFVITAGVAAFVYPSFLNSV
jgi:hypothetical protein